jgi:hypothetical protein
MKTINLPPTPEGYISMLKLLIERSTNAEDVVWAKEELTKLEEPRKQSVLQEHFEQLGFDLGLMDKPNEN